MAHTSNATAGGRGENRRVEVAIMANDDLKNAAEENERIIPVPRRPETTTRQMSVVRRYQRNVSNFSFQ